jgi:hypothetical protein
MRGRPPSLQQAGDTENESAGAHRGDVFRALGLSPHEGDGLLVDHGAGNAGSAAGHTNEVERRAVRKGRRRHEREPALARHRRHGLGGDVGRRIWQPCEDLQRAGEVELRQLGKDDVADIEVRHA